MKTILEMIEEWEKGCTCAGPLAIQCGTAPEGSEPVECHECTKGLIAAIKRKVVTSDMVRVVRVLEYTGPRDVLEHALEQNAVKRQRNFGSIVVREAILGEFPEREER